MIEAFARQTLWKVGLNYGHGTGHGIGNFLSVHECECSPISLVLGEVPQDSVLLLVLSFLPTYLVFRLGWLRGAKPCAPCPHLYPTPLLCHHL